MRLGRADDTETEAARAVRLFEVSPHHMDPTLVRLDVASPRLKRPSPEIEGAATAVRTALEELPERHRTGPVRQRTAEVVREPRRHPTVPAARELVDLVAAR